MLTRAMCIARRLAAACMSRKKRQWDGGTYTGQLNKRGLPHGDGTWRARGELEGTSYIGQWSDGLMHGRGWYRWCDGDSYEGMYEHDIMHGAGVQRLACGDVYSGMIRDGDRHGHGKYTRASNGMTYEGTFSNNSSTGYGILTYVNSYTYTGPVSSSKPHGRGVKTHLDGRRFEGEFVHARRHGNGRQTWACGSSYDGRWVNGMADGHGTYTRVTHGVPEWSYCGDFANDGPTTGVVTRITTGGQTRQVFAAGCGRIHDGAQPLRHLAKRVRSIAA